jgi:hypothetical protein
VRRELAERLSGLPKLDHVNALRHVTACKICGAAAQFFDVVDFNNCALAHDAYLYGPSGIVLAYFRYPICGYLCTNFFDDWSADDFAKYVYDNDYASVDGGYLIGRATRMAEALAPLLRAQTIPSVL